MRLYKVRSAIVHTATSEMSELADIAAIRSLAERMADGKYVSVDVMSDWCDDHWRAVGAAARGRALCACRRSAATAGRAGLHVERPRTCRRRSAPAGRRVGLRCEHAAVILAVGR
jgi:hypothetical protein